MSEPTIWLAVALGGASGAVLRGLAYRLLASFGELGGQFGFAAATLAVNLVGSFAFGALSGALEASPVSATAIHSSATLSAFAIIGFCGALTTFSTFCAGALGLLRLAGRRRLLLYLATHALACPLALGFGGWLAG